MLLLVLSKIERLLTKGTRAFELPITMILIFSVAVDISKAFDRVWHNPSFGFYPSLCSFISSFLSGRSISAVVYGYCSSPKPINSVVPQGSVQSQTLSLLFINYLAVTNCPIHSYADDSTLYFSISFDRRPTL